MPPKGKAETYLANAEVEHFGSWFDVLRLPHDVYGILEPGHIQEVCSFLIIGEKKALLFDTGMGVDDISIVVRQLTDKELIIVNSHSHFDHIGDNWRFPEVYVYKDPYAVDVLTAGFSNAQIRYDAQPEQFTRPLPAGFMPEKYNVRPMECSKIRTVGDGDKFDLGGRTLEVLYTPGHSQDSITLLDRQNRSLFAGDTYCTWVYAMIGPEIPGFGASNLVDYERTMKRLARLSPGLDYLYLAHGVLADPAILPAVARAFELINQGVAEFTEEELYGKICKPYAFDGFMIFA